MTGSLLIDDLQLGAVETSALLELMGRICAHACFMAVHLAALWPECHQCAEIPSLF